MKSFDFQEIYEFDFSFFVVSRFVPKLRNFKKIGARNTFMTDSTSCVVPESARTLGVSLFKNDLSLRLQRKSIVSISVALFYGM